MITLVSPTQTEDKFIFWKDFVIGPYDSLFKMNGEKTSFNSKLRSMEQSRGIFGENNVVHDQISGDLLYQPLVGGLVAAPDSLNPYQVNVPTKGVYAPYGPTWNLAKFGLATHKGTSVRYSTDQAYSVAWFRDPVDKAKWTVYEITVFKSNPTRITNFYKYVVTKYVKSDVLNCYVYYDETTLGSLAMGTFTTMDWTKKRNYEDFVGAESLAMSKTVRTNKYMMATYRTVRIPTTPFSPSTERAKIDSLVANLGLQEFAIPDKHYGDLAMEASQQVNANTVNMIAFIRDLKDVKSLIPKLNQLRNLKGISGNYLAVKYGVLPTISDIKGIIEAFKARKPYFDKNGFKTYGAGFSDSLDKDGVSYSLEQRIKLAISDEDDEFEALLERLENMGTLPTFQNIWDLVPYSFVLDWFVDVGGLLERVDSRLRLTRLNIRYVTMSRKTTVKGTIAPDVEAAYEGTIDWVHYHRWVSDQCPVPPLSLQTTFQDFDHWLESGALLAQRTKH